MKNLIQFIIVVSFTLVSSQSFAGKKEEGYDPGTGIYTKDEYRLIPVTQTYEVMDSVVKNSGNKNIFIYIHGRGRDTKDEWKDLTTIEKTFDAKIIMFHWPSWGGSLFRRPVDPAKLAAVQLAEFFKQIKDYKDQNPEIFLNKKINLLAHSMGHIVLREYTEKYYTHELNDFYGKPLFDNFVSNGADVGLTDHKEWFKAMDFTGKKYVMMNNQDMVLLLSYLLDLKANQPYYYKLGLGFDRIPFKKKNIPKIIDPETTYIDLSRSLKMDHRYFASDKELMINIFKPLLNGEGFHPEKLVGVKVKQEQGIYYVID